MFSRQALRSVRAAAPQRALALRTASVRSFAAAAEVQPPVAVFGVDGTYATALVRLNFPRSRMKIRVPLFLRHCMANWASSAPRGETGVQLGEEDVMVGRQLRD